MKRVLVGHRGVGKTSLLGRHQIYFPTVSHFDLDQEIEANKQKKISEIFSEQGEPQFRHYEKEIFDQLIALPEFVISVGGGFAVDQIPREIEVVFVSRATDKDGRIFLNRPQINVELSDLEDSLKLYCHRQEKFLARADYIYHMPEGIREVNATEKTILSNDKIISPYITVVKNNSWEMRFSNLELRTDILNVDEIIQIAQKNTDKNIIISYRSHEPLMSYRRSHVIYDWALELGEPAAAYLSQRNIVSIHEGSLTEGMQRLGRYRGQHLKLCPMIQSWAELIEGYRWQQDDPEFRNFLPRSNNKNNSFGWFRLIMTPKQKINFIKGASALADQPSLYECLDYLQKQKDFFGGVLGFPVYHSRTPIEQGAYISCPVLSVPLQEVDFEKGISFLQELGLKFAAVTSPLKTVAGNYNSLKYKDQKWLGASTDHFGFKKLLQQLPKETIHQDIVLWGGGGVISALKSEMPNLHCYAARTGAPRDYQTASNPQVVIWGAPRSKEIRFPDEIYPEWKPQWVIDLNYTDNSMGLEYAKRSNIKYISGLEMFLEQARHQREFWKDVL